jgi:hypothetical protein
VDHFTLPRGGAPLAGADNEARSRWRSAYFSPHPVLRDLGGACGDPRAVAHQAIRAVEGGGCASGGVALFLLGIAAFRWSMTIGSPWTRVAGAIAVLMSIPIGALASAGLHLASVLGIVIVMLLVGPERGGYARVERAATS